MRPVKVDPGPAMRTWESVREDGIIQPRSRRIWWLPDLALAGAWVTLFYCLFLFQGYQKLFRDSDAGWHIRTGESILATGRLPRTDPYSFTMAGQPWFAWEWGADVVTGAVHRRAGLRGVAMLYGMAIAGGVWLWFRLHRAMGGDFLIACAMAPLLLSTCNIHWLARPHVFSWLFLMGTLLYAQKAGPRFGAGDALVVAGGTALWANVHASFFFAPLIACVYAAGELLDQQWARARWFVLAALVSSLASFLNPYGWGLHQHLFHYLTNTELLSRIGEFQSFDFHAEGAGQIIACVMVAIMGGALALTQKRYAEFVLVVLIAATALRSARALPLVALMLLPIANRAITQWTGGWNYTRNLARMDARASGWAVCWVVPVFCWLMLSKTAAGFPSDQFPIAACAQVPADARLFAPDKFGGYLIYRYEGVRKVFFDGRSDLYGAGFLKEYGRMAQVRPGWQQIWDRYGFTHALLPNDYSLIPALEARGWRVTYRDGTATLLARQN